jgi:hypothetical protein
MSIKWRNFKMVHRYCDGIDQPIVTPFLPMFFDLWSDPQERYNLTNFRFDFDFMFHVLLKIGIEFKLSTVEYPNIKPGTGDDFDGYHGVKHLADEEKAKIGAHRLANQPEAPMGDAPESPGQARGEAPVPAQSH